MINGLFKCLQCGKSENDIEKMCDCTFNLQFQLSRWSKIKCWFWGLDITYILAFSGAVAMHGAFTHHLKYNITETSISSLGLGFVLGWLNYGVGQNKR